MIRTVIVIGSFVLWGATNSACVDKEALLESSFGSKKDRRAKASPVSVISMGRDDDMGKAIKWHIGGGQD